MKHSQKARILEQLRARREHMRHAKKPARKLGRLPRQVRPSMIALSYFKAIRSAILVPMHALVKREIIPLLPSLVTEAAQARGDSLRMDAPTGKKITDLIARLSREFAAQASPNQIAQMAEEFAERTSDFQKDQLMKQLKAAFGVQPLFTEPSLLPRVEAFTSENVALIKSIPVRYFDDLEKSLIEDVNDGRRWEDIATDLEERFSISEDRAALIARDQVGKFYGELNRVRQTDLGITGYTWRTARDSRVRGDPKGHYPKADPSHFEREGVHFEWSDPPEDGHPGEPINCRCYADPDVSALLDDL